MTWEMTHAQSFPFELGRAPRQVQNAYVGWVVSLLQERPDQAEPPRVKKLAHFKALWRLRISDSYRLVYAVEPSRKRVTCLMLGHRSDVYDRLGANEAGEPGTRIVALAPELLERVPSDDEIGAALHQLAVTPAPTVELLSQPLNRSTLLEWGIRPESADVLDGIRTAESLFAASVPDEVKERVIEALHPRTIDEIRQLPVRVTGSEAQLVEAAEGERALTDFLLALDDEQEAYVQRFRVDAPTGPWLLKGAPGTGKSTVALYCAGGILRAADPRNAPLRILFTTYTNSLIKASQLLMDVIHSASIPGQIDVRTAHSVAWDLVGPEWRGSHALRNEEWQTTFDVAVTPLRAAKPQFPFSSEDAEFIKAEIEWVILGQKTQTLSDYLDADRTGRGRPLNEVQRTAVWTLWDAIKAQLRANNKYLFEEFVVAASERVQPRYDYVFIDEAQDLTPVAIRLLLGLLKNRENVFLAADSNQSIYGAGMSWSRVSTELRFQGRSRILRRNYRSTKEIWAAVRQLASATDENSDSETLEGDPIASGDVPILCWYPPGGGSAAANVVARLEQFLTDALSGERVSRDSAAVLCRTKQESRQVAERLSNHWNAKAMDSKHLDLSHPGVKVTTMHAAKGLQFPVVAVVGVKRRSLPPQAEDASAELARERRLLFVACTRAARRLIVFAASNPPSPFLTSATDDFWVIESLQ